MVGPLAYSLTWGEAFRVKNTRPIWRLLRPVLLAAAAATSWLALSAPAATADSTLEPAPLVTSTSPSVLAIATSAADHAGSDVLQLETEQPPAPSGLMTVIALPALAPANPVATLTDPVATLADTVVGAASAAVLPVIGTVNEILDTVVEPIIDHGVPVPSPIPGTGTALPEVLPGGSLSDVLPGVWEETAPSSPNPLVDVTSESTRTGVSTSSAASAAATSGHRGHFQSPAAVAGSAAPESPAEGGLDALLHPVPAVPRSGAAGSANTGGSPSVPPWLSNHHFMIPSPTASPVRGALLRAPSPVSFEPGSSPD
ncbi:hypothetical protein NicSoilB4_26460 [Arthrobacter sp. NicSoilB4]|nr:hypothetical protein NicSoilB4_26460 [Arthrobacter sp. NicSoilB4]